MHKYMIQLPESETYLVSNSKNKLNKAYKDAVKSMYIAYTEALEPTDERMTLKDMMEYSCVQEYYKPFLNGCITEEV